MQYMLLIVAALAGLSQAYVQLSRQQYEKLLDQDGGQTLNASTYNRLAWDETTNIIYVLAREPRRLTTFTVGEDGTLTSKLSYTFPVTNGEPNDIEICLGVTPVESRLAISFDDATDPSSAGRVRLFDPLSQGDTTLNERMSFTVGSNPVDMEFTQTCLTLVVANQGRPYTYAGSTTDPEGTVSLVTLQNSLNGQFTTQAIGFGSVFSNDATYNELLAKNYRPGPGNVGNGIFPTRTQNVEPVNIIVAPNGLTAYVALPKNNAVARLTMTDSPQVSQIFPSGNRSWANFYMDASVSDGGPHMENYNIFSTLMPVQIQWVAQNDTNYLITLDTGSPNTISAYGYQDWDIPANLAFSSSMNSTLRNQLDDATQLGEALISKLDGVGSDGSTIDDVFMFGGRGISIHDSTSLEIRTALVDNLERVSVQFFRNVFNTAMSSSSNTPQQDRETTSPSTGPNLSVMDSGYFQGNKVLFLGSGTSGMIYVYVLVPDADCPQPFFHSVHREGGTSSSWQSLYDSANIGDLGITDMLYLGDSQDHFPLLFVASATSNSLSVYRVVDAPGDFRRSV